MTLLTCLSPQKKQSEIAGMPEGLSHSELAGIEKAAAKSHRKNENLQPTSALRNPGASRQAPASTLWTRRGDSPISPAPPCSLSSRPGDPIGLVSEAVKILVLPRKPLI
jgi:hypothetical protein